MKVNKKHTVYFAIGALGIGFLAFDRVSTPGQEAEAGAITPDAGSSATPTVSAPAAPHTVVPANGSVNSSDKNAAGASSGVDEQVADHLETIAADRHFNLATTRDAFVAAPSWSTTRPGPVTADDGFATFKTRHKLNSVVVASNRRQAEAMIDGRLLHVGDDLDGFKLTSITKQGAIFHANGRQIELTFRPIDPSSQQQPQSPQ